MPPLQRLSYMDQLLHRTLAVTFWFLRNKETHCVGNSTDIMILKWCLLWTMCFKGYKCKRKREKGLGNFGPGDIQGLTFNIGKLILNFAASVPGRPSVYFRNCSEPAVLCNEAAGLVMREMWTLCGIMWHCVALCGIVWVHQRLQCQLTRVLLCSSYRAVNNSHLGYKTS